MKKYPAVREMNDEQRISVVKDIFATATGQYDFLNHFLSVRQDIAWRRFTAKKMTFANTQRLLDVATGTADLAIETSIHHPAVDVVGVDFVKEMLEVGRRKIKSRGLTSRITVCQGDGTRLPFPDNSFDAVSIAFGIRNIPDRLQALQEMRRVLVPDGRIFVLEMTFTRSRLFKRTFHFYLNRILPVVARPFTKNPQAYYYLADSIMHFPTPEAFAELMQKAGFNTIEMHALTLGVTYLHIGQK